MGRVLAAPPWQEEDCMSTSKLAPGRWNGIRQNPICLREARIRAQKRRQNHVWYCAVLMKNRKESLYHSPSAEGIVSFLAEDVHDGLEGKPLRDVLA